MLIIKKMDKLIEITGISRGEIYSPNHVNNDGIIFKLVAEQLRNYGAKVELIDEKTFQNSKIKNQIIFSMARAPESVKKLIEMDENGALVINSGSSIYNCYRANLTRILTRNSVSYPKSIVVKTNEIVWEELEPFKEYPLWVKRGDVHAIHKEDVVLSYCRDEVNNVLSEFNNRGIKEAVIMEHVYGDIIKFYGVREVGFFHWFNLLDTNHSKFYIEKHVNSNNHTQFDINNLINLAEISAKHAGVSIYGGDVIVKKDKSLCLIDLNDWPSFAPIREIASKTIATYIYNKAKIFIKEGKKSLVINH